MKQKDGTCSVCTYRFPDGWLPLCPICGALAKQEEDSFTDDRTVQFYVNIEVRPQSGKIANRATFKREQSYNVHTDERTAIPTKNTNHRHGFRENWDQSEGRGYRRPRQNINFMEQGRYRNERFLRPFFIEALFITVALIVLLGLLFLLLRQ